MYRVTICYMYASCDNGDHCPMLASSPCFTALHSASYLPHGTPLPRVCCLVPSSSPSLLDYHPLVYSWTFTLATKAHWLPTPLCSASNISRMLLARLSMPTYLSPFIPMTRLPSATHRSKSRTLIRPVLRTPRSSRCRLITPGKKGTASLSSGVNH
jgi:hypothetical protein